MCQLAVILHIKKIFTCTNLIITVRKLVSAADENVKNTILPANFYRCTYVAESVYHVNATNELKQCGSQKVL